MTSARAATPVATARRAARLCARRWPARRARRRCRPSRSCSPTAASTVGGDVSASVGAATTPGSSTTPTTSTRRCGCSASTCGVGARRTATSRVLGEVRERERRRRCSAYALYVRIRPWTRSRVRHPGRAACRRPSAPSRGAPTPSDNPLIGYPLAYQYLTSLRPDALPANADELLRMRGRGWLSSFSIGNPTPDRGVPLVSAFRWDTGVQVHAATDVVDATASVTTGTLVESAVQRRQRRPAGRRARRVAPGRRPDRRRLGRARPVRHARRRRAAPSATATTATSRRRPGAPTSSTRATTTSCASRRSCSDWTLPTIGAPVIDAPLRALDAASKAATRSRRACTRPRASIISASATITGTTGRADVGGAGHARRGRRRLLAAAQPAR